MSQRAKQLITILRGGGFAQFEKKFAHPIYNMHKANLQKLIEMNAACLQSY